MGFMDKLKGFFYDEEEIEEVETPKKVKQPEKKVHRSIMKEEQEIPERELFKAERTFNFPMDMDDEPDFVPVKPSIKQVKAENNNIETPKINREIKRETNSTQVRRPYSTNVEKKEEKKFKPTPIISPIYGIVDGSVLTKNESSSLNETREFSITKKIDFDTVRKKAYGDIHADDEENENKGLFFNLADDEREEANKKIDNEKEESSNINEEDDIKITYNDIDYDSEEEKEEYEIEVPKITRLRKNKKQEVDESEEDAILSETKEQDLFNLIDNMYNSEEDDEEE